MIITRNATLRMTVSHRRARMPKILHGATAAGLRATASQAQHCTDGRGLE